MSKSLYFIALIPSAPLLQKLQELTEQCAQKYQSYKALNSPPHITLYMPFHYEDDKLDELTHSLNQFALNQKDLEISLHGFSSFPPRVIFVAIQENPNLSSLQKLLCQHLAQKLGISNTHFANQLFHPHITLLFKDLKSEVFEQAWNDLKNQKFEAKFAAKHLCLLKHKNGQWKILHTFPFHQI